MFVITRPSTRDGDGRTGNLQTTSSQIDTPNFFALGSRGIVPHASQDLIRDHTDLSGLYVALEDFLDNQHTSNLLSRQHGDDVSLRSFIALPKSQMLILGARRSPPVTTPAPSTQTSLAIMTSSGFCRLDAVVYGDVVKTLKPDIVIGLADIAPGESIGRRRMESMGPRTERWTKSLLDGWVDEQLPALFLPLLPITSDQQRYYLELIENHVDRVQGLTVYDMECLLDLPQPLHHLPKLSLSPSKSPKDLLRQVSMGVDICTVPFLNEATDAGIALNFSFYKVPDNGTKMKRALGLDMWDETFAVDVSVLSQGCKCYGCKTYHRAYIHHLLKAKEMLAWTLIQLHNLAVMGEFFGQIRHSIVAGTYIEDVQSFDARYEDELPAKTGSGPRVRGYQFRSEGPNETRKNPVAFASNRKELKQRFTETIPER